MLAPEIAREFDVRDALGRRVRRHRLRRRDVRRASRAGGFIDRYGPIRVSQACVVVCAIGVTLMAVAPGYAPALLAVSALVIGIGYGPITPASSHLLQRTAPPSRMALTFSIKQTGVPAGAALAGALLPALALAIGWRPAFALVAAAPARSCSALAQPIRARLDADRQPRRGFSFAGIFAPLALLRQSRPLRELALVSLAYSATQVCLTSFLVVHLTETLHWTLVSAGFALAAATVGGVAGRIGWGYVADRLLAPRHVLMLIGWLAGACGVGMALATPQWSIAGSPAARSWCSAPRRSAGTASSSRKLRGSRRREPRAR